MCLACPSRSSVLITNSTVQQSQKNKRCLCFAEACNNQKLSDAHQASPIEAWPTQPEQLNQVTILSGICLITDATLALTPIMFLGAPFSLGCYVSIILIRKHEVQCCAA